MARAHTEHALSEPGTEAPPEPEDISVEVSHQVVGRSPWELFWRRFRRDRFAVGGAFVVIFMFLIAILAPVIAGFTHGPNEVFLDRLDSFGIPTGPQSGFPFGVDTAGRDLFIRVIYGARTSLFIAFFATGIATVIGVTLGMLAGFFRGKTDTVISRTIDVVLSLPVLLLALGLVSACGLEKNGCLGGIIKPGLQARLDDATQAPVLLQAARGHESERQEQDGQGEHDVDRSGDDRVGLPAEEPREHAERDTDDGGDPGREEGDEQRGASAVDDPDEQVPAGRVDAEGEPALGAGRDAERVEPVEEHLVRAVREPRDHRRQDRDQEHEDHDERAAHREPVTAEPAPEQLPRRPADDLMGDFDADVFGFGGSLGAGLRQRMFRVCARHVSVPAPLPGWDGAS